MMPRNERAAFVALVQVAIAVWLYVQDKQVASICFMIGALICMYGAYRPARGAAPKPEKPE